MARYALPLTAIALTLVAGMGVAVAGSGSDCAFANDPDASLDRVHDCMRMGRHVRVDTNVSRGTATLGDGPAAGLRDAAHRRVHVPADPVQSFISGLTGR